MKLTRGLAAHQKTPHPVLTIGNFDGQHLGHRALLHAVVERARAVGGTPLVLTFDPHPLRVLKPHGELQFLSPLDEKLAGFREAGIGEVVLVEFTPTFAALTPDEFVHHVLCESIGAKDVVVGEQFAFGRGRAGRVADLVRLGEGAGFRVHPIAPVRVDGEVVSSTRIRDLIRRGEVRRAARCLGRLYGLTGTVVPGEGRGHKLGWPTANMVLPSDRVVPADGVYATRVLWGGRTWESVSYIGTRPTFGPGERRLEVAVLDTRVDLYGETIRVEFVERLRDDRAFASSDELVAWIERDVSQAREILRAHPQPVPGG